MVSAKNRRRTRSTSRARPAGRGPRAASGVSAGGNVARASLALSADMVGWLVGEPSQGMYRVCRGSREAQGVRILSAQPHPGSIREGPRNLVEALFKLLQGSCRRRTAPPARTRLTSHLRRVGKWVRSWPRRPRGPGRVGGSARFWHFAHVGEKEFEGWR